MLTPHGAATAAAPCHLGFCSSEANLTLWPSTVVSRMSIAVMPLRPHRAIWSFSASQGILASVRRTIDRRWRKMTTVHGCATVALPSHLEFYGSPGIRSSIQRAGPRRSTFHLAPRIERLQPFHLLKRSVEPLACRAMVGSSGNVAGWFVEGVVEWSVVGMEMLGHGQGRQKASGSHAVVSDLSHFLRRFEGFVLALSRHTSLPPTVG
jgi:hypothetical protein